MSIEKSIIDYAMDEDGVQFRNALYASIQDKVSAHIEAAKQNLARNLIATEEVSEEDVEEVQEQYQNPLEFSNKPKRTHCMMRCLIQKNDLSMTLCLLQDNLVQNHNLRMKPSIRILFKNCKLK